jgi:hypothetical protein
MPPKSRDNKERVTKAFIVMNKDPRFKEIKAIS